MCGLTDELITYTMITKEKIIQILHSHSYNVEDQAGNKLIVVDDDSWDEIAKQVKDGFLELYNK